jgi:hypothetical protein
MNANSQLRPSARICGSISPGLDISAIIGCRIPAHLLGANHGARLDARTGAGETVINLTAAHGFRDLLEKLWAEAECTGLTRVLSEYPLHRAASHGQTAIAEFLLRQITS